MTFVEIESKRRPYLFLSNNVKNDVNTARFYPSRFLGGVTDNAERERGEKVSTCLNRRAEGDIIMKIICSYQKSWDEETSWTEVEL